ncbi:DNA alkylation repair protein [Candidatus Uhrbacteria bacterium]|nr:DNA alkylation repair protein [Candidatus Uhrbacteria bacterium]
MSSSAVIAELRRCAIPAKEKILQRFFKTGKGEYGEGDVFLGVTVPEQRKIAKKYRDLGINEVQQLLQSAIHEHRLTALLILSDQFVRADESHRKKLFEFYLAHRRFVNNWDLVDSSAYQIAGDYLKEDRICSVLKELARSKKLWDRRIAIVATLAMIRNGRCDVTVSIAAALLSDEHDLIHKAVGWMLREMGKKSEGTLVRFLDAHAREMPRTMLRYAIERFPEKRRKRYLAAVH